MMKQAKCMCSQLQLCHKLILKYDREGNSREVLHGILRWLFEKSLKLIAGPLKRGHYGCKL